MLNIKWRLIEMIDKFWFMWIGACILTLIIWLSIKAYLRKVDEHMAVIFGDDAGVGTTSAEALWDTCKMCVATDEKYNCKKCKHRYALMAEKIEKKSKG